MSAIKEKEEKNNLVINTDEMAQAGLHFGCKTSRIHPKMKIYVSSVRNAIHLIDLEKTKERLIQALEFVQKLMAENKVLLLVGTKIQMKNLIKETAQECGLPYVAERWLGGTFTNLATILKRMEYYKNLEQKQNSGEWEKYTKKEKIEMSKELKRLEIKFGGIKELSRLPDAVFICDLQKDNPAVKEAKKKNIPVIAICNTNVDPTLADYPIPANDNAISSLKYILNKLKETILHAKH